eukprot:1554660-Pyramimonas_sp.AAC.1
MRRLRREAKGDECKKIRAIYRPRNRRYHAELVKHAHCIRKRSVRSHAEILEVQDENGDARISEDWEEWKQELGTFGKKTFQDDTSRGKNYAVIQDCYRGLGEAEGVKITLSLVLQARSRLRSGGAASRGNISPEMLRLLQWAAVRQVQRLFQVIADRKYCAPGSWKRFLVTLIPKNSQTKNLADTRNICLIPRMSKWCSLCLNILAEQHLASLDASVGIYGFAKGRRSCEITAAIKRIAQHAS